MLDKVSRMLGLSGGFARIDDDKARIAVIDVGSNSVRMVVFDGAERSPAIYFNEKVLCGLGADLSKTGRLSEAGKIRALDALDRFKALADGMDSLRVIDAVGTAALRDAEDGEAFVDQLQHRTGLDLRVASGADEARLAAQGVVIGEPDASGVVADIGGASMELVELNDGVVGHGVTTPLGPLRFDPMATDADTRIDGVLEAAVTAPGGGRRFAKGRDLHIVGGSWRALVKAHMASRKYPLRVLHGFSLPGREARAMADWGARLTVEAVREHTSSSERRAVVTPGAARVLARLIRALDPKRVTLSAFGLREGVLWEHLPEDLRRQDPLLQPCAVIERRESRRPGFGAELWDWLAPTLPNFEPERVRLARAACLLCDASWRTHPDYRSISSFELVTRNNFGGVDHRGRVFIGAALLYRNKNAKDAMEKIPATELITRSERLAARALGRGMRLGAMLGAASSGILPNARLERDKNSLTLELCGPTKKLAGEELSRRLRSFAEALELDHSEVRAG